MYISYLLLEQGHESWPCYEEEILKESSQVN